MGTHRLMGLRRSTALTFRSLFSTDPLLSWCICVTSLWTDYLPFYLFFLCILLIAIPVLLNLGPVILSNEA